ncbi:hypothetical protein [Chitinimonas sp. JJ19]|uniref:hypothetical protein n=1 Tax=Chitinimonas sp. JJ19 TaxID=3109352 RepID=UPI0030023FE8
MSYDLMVFASEAAPKDREAFLAWYDEQSEWEEAHSYDNPEVSTPALRAWFLEMIQAYPAMNGPFSSTDQQEDEVSVTDYSVGCSVIYSAFQWPQAEQAYVAMFSLAGKHGVGFFNVSSDKAEVWLPDGKGGLSLAHSD